MFYSYNQSEIRNICREKIESLEHWLRRLIDETFVPLYGDYFSYKDADNNRLISSKIVSALEARIKREPGRYPRKVDAILLSDAIDIICNRNLYTHFQEALCIAFPEGHSEAKTFLQRLNDPRNNLAHANSISMRDAERIVCYSHDVIDSLKAYYVRKGMNQDYNVPLILKFTDSFGNVVHRTQMREKGIFKSISFKKKPEFFLRPGDTLSLEIEVDPSFDKKSYSIDWGSVHSLAGIETNTNRIVIPLNVQHVGQNFSIICSIKTKNEWHRLDNHSDDKVVISYTVLPPQ